MGTNARKNEVKSWVVLWESFRKVRFFTAMDEIWSTFLVFDSVDISIVFFLCKDNAKLQDQRPYSNFKQGLVLSRKN